MTVGMSPGEVMTLTIEKPVAGGRMLARHDGAVVLVWGALPGEVVEAVVEREQRGTVWARVTRVMEPSPERAGEPEPCGGAVLAHASPALQLVIKQRIIADAFERLARLPLEAPVAIGSSSPRGYRMRARLHVAGSRIGFFNEGTHVICDAAATGQLLPSTGEVIESAGRIMARSRAGVEALDLAENRDASARALHVTVARGIDPSSLAELGTIDGVTGVSVSHEGSPRVRVLAGDPRVADRFERGQARWMLSRDARAFFQGNRYLLDSLVTHVVDQVPRGAVTDLYAGVGLFSVALAAQGRDPVVAVEGDEVAAIHLRENAREWRGVLRATHDAVERYLRDRRALSAPAMVLDPPRTGLSRQALGGVIAAGASRLVYVSCDVPTLARDTRALLDAGYRLAGLKAFDLFPATAHVETVAVLER